MGKYSLVVVNRLDNSEHIINVYDIEKKVNKDKVHIKDIDLYTSQYASNDELIRDLNQKGIISFNNGFSYIISKYKEKELHFKTIYNAALVTLAAKSVTAGFVNPNVIEGYNDLINDFFSQLKNSNFATELRNTIYISPSVRNLFDRYINILNKEKYREEDLKEERILISEIKEELKRYKTFRGLYIFLEEYKKNKTYTFTRNNPYNGTINKTKTIQVEQAKEYQEKKLGFRDVDMYNKEHEEFLSEEEYNDAFGQNDDEFSYTYKRSKR